MQNFSRRSIDRQGNGLDPLDEDLVYERQPKQSLRVVNGGIEPRHMRKGSYVEDDTYSVPLASTEDYGALPTFPSYTSGGAVPDVSGTRLQNTRDQLGVPDPRRSSGRNVRSGTARRSLILGPQPQPQLYTNTYGNYQPAPKPKYPTPSTTIDYYRQQQQQQQPQQQNYSRQSRQSSQGLASPGLGRYSPPLEADEDAEDENMRSRSIMIGFEQPSPSTNLNSQWSIPPSGSGNQAPSSSYVQTASNLQIHGFPHPPPPQPPHTQTLTPTSKRVSSSSNVSTITPGKRGNPVSSYYSQASYVTPIPEELSEYGRHGSFASSHAIPSSWGSGIPGLWIPNTSEELMSDGASSISKGSGNSRGKDYEDYDEGTTLVRQASMGRKAKPKLANIGPSDKSDTKSKSSKSESSSVSQSQGKRSSMSSLKNEPRVLVKEKTMTQPIGSPMEIADDLQPPPKIGFWQRLSQLSLRSSTSDLAPKPLRLQNGKNSPDARQKEGQNINSAAGFGYNLSVPQPTLNRPRPPRLNMDAVREAEARGSLTSLPDLIRRATKLAAVLETGNRPESHWGGSRAPSIMSTDTNNHRYQESLSDILASFPPPLASGRDLSTRGTAWPLPPEMEYIQEADTPSIRRKRKICGLPLWAFVLIIILGLIIVAAAVILPIQFIGLSNKDKKNEGLTQESCRVSNPCLNGGISNVNNGHCECVCTNQFIGPDCGELSDPACTTFAFQNTTARPAVQQNATIGVALPRLFGVAQSQYNIPIDQTALLNTFSSQNTACALQNALVMLNGRTSPPAQGTRTSGVALDEATIDFARVAVLYLAEAVSMSAAVDARDDLSALFSSGKDYGVVTVGESEIDLTRLRISTGDGTVVGNLAATASKLAKTKRTSEYSSKHLLRRHQLFRKSW